MLSYALAGLAGIVLALGGQKAARSFRPRTAEVVPYLTIEESRQQNQALMNTFLDEIKVEANERDLLARSIAGEREDHAAQGGLVHRTELSQALEQLHQMHQGQLEGLHRALVSVVRQVELQGQASATASRVVAPVPAPWPLPALSAPFTPLPVELTPAAPIMESPFPEGVATVPLRRVNLQTAQQGYTEAELDPSELLAGLRALRGLGVG